MSASFKDIDLTRLLHVSPGSEEKYEANKAPPPPAKPPGAAALVALSSAVAGKDDGLALRLQADLVIQREKYLSLAAQLKLEVSAREEGMHALRQIVHGLQLEVTRLVGEVTRFVGEIKHGRDEAEMDVAAVLKTHDALEAKVNQISAQHALDKKTAAATIERCDALEKTVNKLSAEQHKAIAPARAPVTTTAVAAAAADDDDLPNLETETTLQLQKEKQLGEATLKKILNDLKDPAALMAFNRPFDRLFWRYADVQQLTPTAFGYLVQRNNAHPVNRSLIEFEYYTLHQVRYRKKRPEAH